MRWKAHLRIINKRGGLVPGSTHTIKTANQTVQATVVLRGPGWQPEDFAGFRFVSDYEVQGLQNHYHNYGLGVPLIAERKQHDPPSPAGKVLSAGHELPGDGLPAGIARASQGQRRITWHASSCTTR